jgi:hypothetical protein
MNARRITMSFGLSAAAALVAGVIWLAGPRAVHAGQPSLPPASF